MSFRKIIKYMRVSLPAFPLREIIDLCTVESRENEGTVPREERQEFGISCYNMLWR